MRKLAAVLMAVMIVLAGCSGGGGTATPGDAADDAPDDETPMDTDTDDSDTDNSDTDDSDTDNSDTDDSDTDNSDTDDSDTDDGSQTNLSSVLSNSGTSDPLSNATEIDVTLFNGSQEFNILIQNDTDSATELIRLTRPSGDATTLYMTSDYTAFRNETTGETQYGESDGRVGQSFAFGTSFAVFGSLIYAGILDWESTGTMSADGGTVFEADSLNQTALDSNENLNFNFDRNEVSSVDGRIVVNDEKIQSIDVTIETSSGTFGTELSVNYDPITITQPDWVDESQAP